MLFRHITTNINNKNKFIIGTKPFPPLKQNFYAHIFLLLSLQKQLKEKETQSSIQIHEKYNKANL